MIDRDDTKDSTCCTISAELCWVVVFLILISLPLFLRGFFPGEKSVFELRGETLRARLSSFEDQFSTLPLFEFMRDSDQRRLTELLRLGNSRVVVGNNGWLHYRADIDAVVGKGPYYEEPPSVSRAPGLKPWNRPEPVIREFVEQLREREIELVLVPVPTKVMVVSLSGESRILVPDGYDDLIREIRKTGVEIIDLIPLLREPESFLKHDTHWTPDAMERSAARVAQSLGTEGEMRKHGRSLELEMSGDLNAMLFQEDFDSEYANENVLMHQVLAADQSSLLSSDVNSPWVLLGDSFVNVFDDPSLGFPERDVSNRLGAGFASHLAGNLGKTLHVIAMNGSGATGVRKAFAALPDEVVRSKEKVIWVLSARDLLLAEIPGRRAGIAWDRVEFSERPGRDDSVSGEVIITATLQETSSFGDPETTPYASAVYSTVFGGIEVEQGTYESSEAHVFLWAFRDREIEDSGRLEVGKRYRLELTPFPVSGPASQAKQLDDFFLPDLTPVFAETIRKID